MSTGGLIRSKYPHIFWARRSWSASFHWLSECVMDSFNLSAHWTEFHKEYPVKMKIKPIKNYTCKDTWEKIIKGYSIWDPERGWRLKFHWPLPTYFISYAPSHIVMCIEMLRILFYYSLLLIAIIYWKISISRCQYAANNPGVIIQAHKPGGFFPSLTIPAPSDNASSTDLILCSKIFFTLSWGSVVMCRLKCRWESRRPVRRIGIINITGFRYQ